METQLFNPNQLLTKLATTEATGILKASYGSSTWHIHLIDGELQYADCAASTLSQLSYFFSQQNLEKALPALKEATAIATAETGTQAQADNASDAQDKIRRIICHLQTEQILEIAEIQKLIEAISRDALESFLWLREGQTTWLDNIGTPSWTTLVLGNTPLLKLDETVSHLQLRLKGWQRCSPAIQSPYQRPYLLDFRDISKPIQGGKLTPQALSKLAQLMSRGFSIRQLSTLLKQSELQVAQLLDPYIEQGAIVLREPKPPFDGLPKIPSAPKPPKPVAQSQQATHKIVCIDDSPTILSEIERFLDSDRYDVTTVDDPIQASSIIFRIKPDLILLDITMPKINGYRLCSLLRSSAAFDETPIIMVTGNTGFIDKARAKIAGATDYFTKPFSQEGLTSLVEKYLTATAASIS